jgi:peptide/nickel transport system ATP-binding protein
MAGSGTAGLRPDIDSVLRVEHLVVEFPAGKSRRVHAVSDLTFDLARGESLGLVGESGSGKSSTAQAIMQLPPPSSGSVVFEGTDLAKLKGKDLRSKRPRMQMIFQDPISSLNPRRSVADSIAEPLRVWGRGREAEGEVRTLLEAVGLDYEEVGGRKPRHFSGGQCQRIAIARALVLEPSLLICDEPVSSLDVSIQAQILNLLHDMRDRYGLTILFISHDLAVVRNISDRVAVIYLGKLCELGSAKKLYATPKHPYTAALLDAIPVPDAQVKPKVLAVSGNEAPSPINPPSGCRYRTRCPRATELCAHEEPVVRQIEDDHFVACHFPLES